MDIRLTCSIDCRYFEPSNELGSGYCTYPARKLSPKEVYQWQDCKYGLTIDPVDCISTFREREEGKRQLIRTATRNRDC